MGLPDADTGRPGGGGIGLPEVERGGPAGALTGAVRATGGGVAGRGGATDPASGRPLEITRASGAVSRPPLETILAT